MTESGEELVERLEQAALDAREATREAHEALTDLRVVIKEARELLAQQVEREVDQRVKREVDRQLASLSKRVKRTLAEKGIK
jgi:anti-sigma factor RsiW